MSSDPFQEAVLCSLAGAGTDGSMRREALEYLENIKTDPFSWKYTLERLSARTFFTADPNNRTDPSTANANANPAVIIVGNPASTGVPDCPEVSFVCLQLLIETVTQRYSTLTGDERLYLRTELMKWAVAAGSYDPNNDASKSNTNNNNNSKNTNSSNNNNGISTSPLFSPGSSYLVPKFASLFALVIAAEFPESWGGVFGELLAALAGPTVSASSLLVFLKILEAVDREIVSPTVHRGSGEFERGIAIKDAMRLSCVADLARAWHAILATYAQSHPDLVALTLHVVGAFVDWIDITLIVNDNYIPLLYGFLASPVSEVREGAAECLLKIVEKGAAKQQKVEMLSALRLDAVISELTQRLVAEGDDDEDFLSLIARLLSVSSISLLEAISTALPASPAGKSGKQQQGGPQAPLPVEVLATAQELFASLMPLLLGYAVNEDDDVSRAAFPALSLYGSQLGKSPAQSLTAAQNSHARTVCEVSLNKCKFDPSFNHEHRGSDEEEFLEYRQELTVIFRSFARACPDVIKSFLQELISQTVAGVDAGNTAGGEVLAYDHIESALHLLHAVPDAIPEHTLKVDDPVFSQLISLIVRSSIAEHPHPAVVMRYLGVIWRYSVHVAANGELLSLVMRQLVGLNGIHNNSPSIRARACYYTSKIVKSHRTEILPILDGLLSALVGALEINPDDANNNNNNNNNNTGKGSNNNNSGSVGHNNVNNAVINSNQQGNKSGGPAFDDQVYLFEAVGLLIGGDGIEDEQRQRYMEAFLGSLTTKIHATLPNFELASMMVAALGHMTKGFTPATCDLEYVARYLTGALEAALATLDVSFASAAAAAESAGSAVLYTSPNISSRVVFFLHRMVTCLRAALLPHVPRALEQLIRTHRLKELTEAVRFATQVTTKFKSAVSPLWNKLLIPFVTRIFAVVREGEPTAPEQLENEQGDLQRVYYHMLNGIVSSSCAGAFVAEDNAAHFQSIIGTIIEGCSSSSCSTQKVCFAVLARMVKEWAGQDESFAEFVYMTIVPACFSVVFSPEFDIGDAATMLVLAEIAALHRTIFAAYGANYESFLAQNFFPKTSIPPDMATQFVTAVSSPDVRFKGVLRNFVAECKRLGVR